MPETEVETAAIAALEAEEERADAEASEATARAAVTAVAAAESAAALAATETARATQSAAEFLRNKEGDIECLKQHSTQSAQQLQTIATRQEQSDSVLSQMATQMTHLSEAVSSLIQRRLMEAGPENVNPEGVADPQNQTSENQPPPPNPPQKKRRFI